MQFHLRQEADGGLLLECGEQLLQLARQPEQDLAARLGQTLLDLLPPIARLTNQALEPAWDLARVQQAVAGLMAGDANYSADEIEQQMQRAVALGDDEVREYCCEVWDLVRACVT